jgi:hypothetical protein
MRRVMWYHYKSLVGTFWICPEPNNPSRYLLGIDDTALGSYHSSEAAADDVYTQSTGWSDWDMLDPVVEPTDLSKWEKGKPDI